MRFSDDVKHNKKILTHVLMSNLEGGQCPVCLKYFEPNGTGPEGKEFTHWLLKLMPWDEILNELAVPMHDWRCHIGAHKFNLTFDETTQEFRKNVRDAVYRWCIKRWWRRWFYNPCFSRLDEIYAFAVGETSAGKKAYDSDSCIV
jgi:hypothetical protein